jgi:hypothetical protein
MSPVQELKMVLVQTLHLAKDGFHIYIGFAVFMLAVTLGRDSARSYKALIPSLVVSLLLEALDLNDDFNSGGALHWATSLKDVVNTNIIPTALVLAARFGVFDAASRRMPSVGRRPRLVRINREVEH